MNRLRSTATPRTDLNGGILLKKTTSLVLSGVIALMTLSGCSSVSTTIDTNGEGGSFQPETTVVPSITAEPDPESWVPEILDLPLDEDSAAQPAPEAAEPSPDAAAPSPEADAAGQTPVPTLVPTTAPSPSPTPVGSADISGYTYQTLTDTSFGFVYTYPTCWVNVPGKSTVCFREVVEPDDFPARVAVTSKRMAHTPKSDTVLSQFQSYAQYIYAQFDPTTFEWGDLNTNARFLGEKAFEITYLAYSGDIEIKGYMICTNVGRLIYVYHFCASYDDYAVMETMMGRMRDSVTIID